MSTLSDIVALQASLNYWTDELTSSIRAHNTERCDLCRLWIERYQSFMYLAIDATAGTIV